MHPLVKSVGIQIAVILLPSVVHAACVAPNLAINAATVDQFTANPASTLGKYPTGDAGLATEVRNLVVSDPRTLDGVGVIAASGNAAQRNSIGTALGQATVICRRTDPQFTRQIQELVIRLNLPELVTAYNTVTGETRTTAVGGGGAGGGAGGGGGTATGLGGGGGTGSGYTAPSTSATTNAPGAFSAGSGIAAASPSSVSFIPASSSTTGLTVVSPTSPGQ